MPISAIKVINTPPLTPPGRELSAKSGTAACPRARKPERTNIRVMQF